MADIVIIAIMALCVFLGYKRGLIGVGVRVIGFIISLVVALILYSPISNYIINNTNIKDNLKETIQSKMYNEEQMEDEGTETEKNASFTQSMEKYVEKYSGEIKENTSEFVSEEVAIAVIRIGTWICLFAIARIVTIFIKVLGKIIEKIPIIKQFNKARWNNIWYIRRICNHICGIRYN